MIKLINSYCVIATLLLYLTVHVAYAQEHNASTKLYTDGCECIRYDCGCCAEINWNQKYLSGPMCANVTYLDQDYGVSITVTFGSHTLINETVSVRNPPPICAVHIIEVIPLSLCLRIYDIDITKSSVHFCLEIDARVTMIKMPALRLGCVNYHGSVSHDNHWWTKLIKWNSKTEDIPIDLVPNVIQT